VAEGLTFILISNYNSHRGCHWTCRRSVEYFIKVSSEFELTFLFYFLLLNQPIDQLMFSVLNLLIIEFFPYFIYHRVTNTLQMLYGSLKSVISHMLNLDVYAFGNQNTSLLRLRTYSTCDINSITDKRKLRLMISNHSCNGSTLIQTDF
jgi:hypothetical protein